MSTSTAGEAHPSASPSLLDVGPRKLPRRVVGKITVSSLVIMPVIVLASIVGYRWSHQVRSTFRTVRVSRADITEQVTATRCDAGKGRLSALASIASLGFGALRRNRMLSQLTSLGVIIGVGALIVTVASGEGSKAILEPDRCSAIRIDAQKDEATIALWVRTFREGRSLTSVW